MKTPTITVGERPMSAAIPEGTAREFLQIERSLPRRGNGWRARGQPEALQDRYDRFGLGDRENDCRSSSTFLAPQNIFSEDTHHQLRPGQPSLTQAARR